MIKRPHNYSGECIDCTDKKQCRFGYECPFIDNENRPMSCMMALSARGLIRGCCGRNSGCEEKSNRSLGAQKKS